MNTPTGKHVFVVVVIVINKLIERRNRKTNLRRWPGMTRRRKPTGRDGILVSSETTCLRVDLQCSIVQYSSCAMNEP